MYYILDIVLIAIVVLFAILGAKKGFAKTLIELVGYVLAFVIAFSVGNYAADYIYENSIKEAVVTSVSDLGKESVGNAVMDTSETVDKIWDSIPPYISAFSGISGVDKDTITKYVESNAEKTNDSIENLAVSVAENVIKPIAVSAIKLVITVVLIILLLFVVKFLAKVIGGFFNKSVFKGANRFLGFISGAVKGILICAAIAALILILLPMFDNKIYFITPKEIGKTYIFKYLFDFVKSF